MKTVLIVDDDTDLNLTLSSFFLHKGIRVLTAGSFSEGMEKAARKRIDLALFDYQLGDGYGDELLAEFRAIHPKAPVIIISGYEERIVSEMAKGADLFLKKPLDLNALEGWVKILTDKAERGAGEEPGAS